jgi:hypothetical protein
MLALLITSVLDASKNLYIASLAEFCHKESEQDAKPAA